MWNIYRKIFARVVLLAIFFPLVPDSNQVSYSLSDPADILEGIGDTSCWEYAEQMSCIS